jgi:hypothetical protein
MQAEMLAENGAEVKSPSRQGTGRCSPAAMVFYFAMLIGKAI